MIDPEASDWSDLDLLTLDEARERLTDAVADTQRDIARAESTDDTTKLVVLRRRLELLQKRMES